MNILDKCKAWAGKQRKQKVKINVLDKQSNLLYVIEREFVITDDVMDWEIPLIVDDAYKPYDYSTMKVTLDSIEGGCFSGYPSYEGVDWEIPLIWEDGKK